MKLSNLDLAEDVPAYYREAGLNASPSDSVTLVYISSLTMSGVFSLDIYLSVLLR